MPLRSTPPAPPLAPYCSPLPEEGVMKFPALAEAGTASLWRSPLVGTCRALTGCPTTSPPCFVRTRSTASTTTWARRWCKTSWCSGAAGCGPQGRKETCQGQHGGPAWPAAALSDITPTSVLPLPQVCQQDLWSHLEPGQCRLRHPNLQGALWY